MQCELEGIPEKVQNFMNAVPLDDELDLLRTAFLMYFFVYIGESSISYNASVFRAGIDMMQQLYGSFHISFYWEE